MNSKLMLGVARRDITPEIGANLMGYNPTTISNAINDNLTATAFVFRYGETKAAMVSITVCVISDDITDMLRRKINEACGIPFENILLSAIHTHSGPITSNRNVGWGKPDPKYLEEVFYPGILDAVKEANGKLINVEMGYAFGNSYVGVNRREFDENNNIQLGQCEWAPFNPKMTVLSFRDENKNVVANMIHYGCHATAAGNNLEISRDWPGVMADRLEAESGAITAFFPGPEGDVGPRLTNGRTTGKKVIKYAMEHGALAGNDAVNIYKKITHYCDAPLSCAERKLQLKLTKRLPLEEAKERLIPVANATSNHPAQERDYYERIIKSYEEGYQDKEYLEVPQVAIKLGDIAFLGFTYELFSEIGMRINKMSSIGHVLSLACTNGTDGYFPTEDQLCRGGYEVKMFKTRNLQPYAENADFNLICESLKTLDELN